jgi:hypothetical protein
LVFVEVVYTTSEMGVREMNGFVVVQGRVTERSVTERSEGYERGETRDEVSTKLIGTRRRVPEGTEGYERGKARDEALPKL